MKNLVSLGYKKLPQADLESFAKTVYERMSTDAQFIPLKTWVDALGTANAALAIAMANARKGGEAQTIIKNNCLKAVKDALDDIAYELNKLANDNELVVLAAGYDTHKEPKPINEVPIPTNPNIKNAEPTGALRFSWKGNSAAISYLIEWQTKGDTVWHSNLLSTRQDIILESLPISTFIYARVCAIGRKNLKSDFTEPVGVIVI